MASNATLLQIVLDEIAEEAPTVVRGDVNHDGLVNITDVSLIISYVLGTVNDIDLVAADYNNDGTISITDVSTLINYLITTGR